MWGEVLLGGYRGGPMQLNTFMLNVNIGKATAAPDSTAGLVRGIWTDETQLDRALQGARNAVASADSQDEIDYWDRALDRALRALRRKGKYPDPYDLPTVNNLPDPFTFFSGRKVRFPEDWRDRRAEIKDLAQYYEFGYMPAAPRVLTAVSTDQATSTLKYKSIAITVQDKGNPASFTPVLYLPTTGSPPYPVIVEEDIFANPGFAAPNPAFLNGGYAVLSIPTWDFPAFGLPGIASDDGNHTGAFFNLYPYKLDNAGDDHGVLLAWAWGASRGVDALHYLAAHDPTYANLLDLRKLVVTGYSRWGKAALLAGMLDERFQLTAPGGSGSGGATPYRYDSYGNVPFRHAPFGNLYPWGRSTGAETMGDHVRHQTHNSNEMIRRFLNDIVPAAVEPRMYQTDTWGYGERLPYDHHEEIAAIAPRAVLIDATNNDYADNAEGDAIGFEGAKPIYECFGVPQNLALDLDMGNTGHALTPAQAQHIVDFANFVLNGTPLTREVKTQLTTDPYLQAGTYDTYYGGLETMLPWAGGRHSPCETRHGLGR
jgi:endo-1,4-beta-xylanase